MRNLASLPVRAVCAGVTTNTSIEVPTEQLYNSSFYITYYIVADENDYPGSKTESIPGVSGLFKPQFLAALRLNGSGRDTSNRYLSYYGGTYSLQNPTTASGTTPTVGQTIAVDPFYIPMVNRSGWKRGAVDIMTTGLRRAEDTGGAIDDFHIDVYVGVGMSNVTENNHNSAVLFKGVNTWGSFSNSSYSAENYWNEADLAAEKSVKTVWNSENEELCAFVSIKDYTNSESRIEVTVAETTETNNAISRLSLSTFALNLIDVTFINDSLIGIESYINPSTNVYEIFDLNTGTVVDVYYGHGFTHYGDTIYYIQSPQHFSGIRGKNRILTSTGILVYESDADVTISATLDIKNDNIYFMENNSANGEKEMRNIKICNNIMQPKGEEVYYY